MKRPKGKNMNKESGIKIENEFNEHPEAILKDGIKSLTARYPSLSVIQESLIDAGKLLFDTFINGNKLLICGNGGSAADADHIVGELVKSFRKPRSINSRVRDALISIDPVKGSELADHLQEGVPAMSLTQHTALSTAFANDVHHSMGFAQQTFVLGNPGDLLLALSTSGNSENVLYAAVTAKARTMKVLGMTGRGGGKLRSYCDVLIPIPEDETYKIQELHLPVYHVLCMFIENSMWYSK